MIKMFIDLVKNIKKAIDNELHTFMYEATLFI